MRNFITIVTIVINVLSLVALVTGVLLHSGRGGGLSDMFGGGGGACLLYTSPSPRDGLLSRMPSSA